MTDKEANIAVADACGWNRCHCGKEGCYWHPKFPGHEIRDYGRDLNAMAEAVMTLNINQLSAYADELDKICVPVHICALTHWLSIVEANAEQRREAFLRAIGKWIE